MPLNWKKIVSVLPNVSTGKDRPPTVEEIRKIYSTGDLRLKFAVSFFVSTGAREGSVDYLRMKDVEVLKELGIASVRIYRGEPEEYYTFLNEEALENYNNYIEYRQRNGEIITPESPVFRTQFDPWPKKPKEGEEPKIRGIEAATSEGIKQLIKRAWANAGLRERDFAMVHGFRSYFKTVLTDEGSSLKSEQVEKMMGHGAGKIANRYYRPEVLKLGKAYTQNEHLLFIDEARTVKLENKVLQEDVGEIKALTARMDAMASVMADMQKVIDERQKEVSRTRVSESYEDDNPKPAPITRTEMKRIRESSLRERKHKTP